MILYDSLFAFLCFVSLPPLHSHTLSLTHSLSLLLLQLLMFLTMSLDCRHDDSALLVSIVTTFSSRLFPEEGVTEIVKRNHTHETRLLYLRFINILMSRKKDRSKESKVSKNICSYVLVIVN